MIQINNPIVIANSQAAFTRVQHASTAHAISASSPITISKAFVSGNAAGNMIIVVLGIWNNANLSAPPTATMSDSAGNSYTLIKLLTLSRTVTSNGACYAWVAFNIAGGANTVSTVATFGNGAATQIDGELMILEYQPPLAGAAQDQLNFATSIVSTASLSTGNITEATTPVLVFTWFYDFSTSRTLTTIPAGGLPISAPLETPNNAGGDCAGCADGLSLATGTASVTWNWGAGTDSVLLGIVSFK